MADFIELSGTAGTGKSTTYRQMVAMWEKANNWLPAHYFFPKRKLSDASDLKGYISHLLKVATNSKNLGDKASLVKAGDRFVDQNRELIDLCFSNINSRQKNSLDGKDHRFDKTICLYALIQKLQTVIEYNSDKPALLDEGPLKLIDMLFYTGCTLTPDAEQQIRKVLNLVPLPKACIYIESDAKENVKRLLHRGAVIKVHKDLNAWQLEKATVESQKRKALVNEILASKSIPILYINSNEDLKSNCDKIHSFLSLCKNRQLNYVFSQLSRGDKLGHLL